MLRLAKAFWEIALWRKSPAHLPASVFLLSLGAAAVAALDAPGGFEHGAAVAVRLGGAGGRPSAPTFFADRYRIARHGAAGAIGLVPIGFAAQCRRYRSPAIDTIGGAVVRGSHLVFAGLRKHMARRARFTAGVGRGHQRGVPLAFDGIGAAAAPGALTMHVHILGIAGTFMGGLAAIAKAAGFRVTGADLNVYPPMSTQLTALGIEFVEGYGAEQLDSSPDIVVVGNALSRGSPVV